MLYFPSLMIFHAARVPGELSASQQSADAQWRAAGIFFFKQFIYLFKIHTDDVEVSNKKMALQSCHLAFFF